MTEITDKEVADLLAMPKRVGERLRWQRRGDDRPEGRELRATIIAHDNPDIDRSLKLAAHCFRSRGGYIVWTVAIIVSGLKPPLIRIDTHDKPHKNRDGSLVRGCMMHTWTEAEKDGLAISAGDIIDCTSVDTALMGFLDYCNITLTEPYQMRFDGGDYGTV